MREGWEREILKKVTVFKSGKTVSKDIEKDSGAVIYAKVGDMNLKGNEVNITTSSRFVDLSDINGNQIIPIGSVIFPKRGGAIATNKKRKVIRPTIVDLNTMAIVPTAKLDSEYLYYWFQSIDLQELSNGTSIPQINNNSFDKVHITYPKSLVEQKKIVSLLDEAVEAIDQAKANIEKNIENAKELFQSKLNEIFSQKCEGWDERTLGEVCDNLDSKRVPITKSKRIAGEIPYYGASGIVDYVADYLFDEDLLLVSEDGANLLARTYPIAFSISGKNWVNNHAHVLRFSSQISQKFIEYYLNSIKLDDYVSGMAQPKLNQRMLNSIPVPFPTIDKQNKVLKVISSLDLYQKSIKELYVLKLQSLEELKKSIFQKAFAGDLTKNWVESGMQPVAEENVGYKLKY
ncbi:restriction endonuclease subunit S [Arenibacter arenosicollis]|nr:restriction endonuclease subunit S [Arenibacter arenosicollis]